MFRLRTTRVSGVGTPKQTRRVASSGGSIPIEWDVKIAGNDAADLLTSGIEEGIRVANQIVAEKLAAALDDAIDNAVWQWDEGGARDIYDTGKLKASRSVVVNGNKIIVSYDVPYAGIVHFGGYVIPYGNPNAEKVYLPARPWVDSVILGGGPVPKFDFESIYIQAIEDAFR